MTTRRIIRKTLSIEDPRRSTCQRRPSSFGSDFVSLLLENDPQTYKAPMSSSVSSYWKKVVNSEIESILNNHTWELTDLPRGNKPLWLKWIFKRKMKPDGTTDKHKARIIVKGYRKKEGLNYFDTYSPVKRITSMSMLIALAVVHDLKIYQMDLKTTFLNWEFEKEFTWNNLKGL